MPQTLSLSPMLCTGTRSLPADAARWAYEFKLDGMRALVFAEGGQTRVLSRHDTDFTARFPELHGIAAALPSDAVLDGEVVALDPSGRCCFERLRRRILSGRGLARLVRECPLAFVAWDVLSLGGSETTRLTYRDRRQLLESLSFSGTAWATLPQVTGSGQDAMRLAAEANMAGIICKRVDAPYRCGQRSRTWLKIKFPWHAEYRRVRRIQEDSP